MTAPTLTEELASFARALAPPERIRARALLHLTDTLGVAIAAVPLPTSRIVIDHALESGGASQATAIGITHKVPAPGAAFVNGVLAHSLDYDDTHLPSILHPSAPVVPAVLAAAELAGASGRATLDALIAGIEVCARLGMAGYDARARQSIYFERGQHATSMCGAIAAAAGAALLLAPDEIEHAMGIAVSMASGVIEGNRAGGTVKRMHCGIAARAGVEAAMLARRGITGPPTALEGRFGFFQAMLGGTFDADAVRDGLNHRWEIDRLFIKPYPANHFTHAAIDAAWALRARGISPADIEHVSIGVATPTVRTIGEPIERKRAPETGYEAQFSGPYTFVAALLGGSGLGVGLPDFTDALARDPQRRALMERIDVIADDECDAIYPMQFPAVVRARALDGTEHVERVLANRGGPERPLSADELAVKFRDNAARALPGDAVADIEGACARLETLPSVEALLAPTADAK